MDRRNKIALITVGILAVIAVSGPVTQSAASLLTTPSSQQFYANERGQSASLLDNDSSHVNLRDTERTAAATYDTSTSTVLISPNELYTKEVGRYPMNVERLGRHIHEELFGTRFPKHEDGFDPLERIPQMKQEYKDAVMIKSVQMMLRYGQTDADCKAMLQEKFLLDEAQAQTILDKAKG